MVHVEYTSYSRDRITHDFGFTAVKQMVKAVRHSDYIHSRTRFWCRHDVTSIYHKDSSSPSGKILAGSGPDPKNPMVDRRVARYFFFAGATFGSRAVNRLHQDFVKAVEPKGAK